MCNDKEKSCCLFQVRDEWHALGQWDIETDSDRMLHPVFPTFYYEYFHLYSWPLLQGDQISISLFLHRNILYRPVLGGPRAFVYVCVVAVDATCPMLLAAIYTFCTLPLSSFL